MRTRMIGAAMVAAMSCNLAAVAAPAEAEQKVKFTQPVAVTPKTDVEPVLVTAEKVKTTQLANDANEESLSSKVGSVIGLLVLMALMLRWYGWNNVNNPNGRHADLHMY